MRQVLTALPHGVQGRRHSFGDPTRQRQHGQVGIRVSRDRVKRNREHQRREMLQEAEQDGETHICRMLGDSGELCGNAISGGGPGKQDHAGDTRCNVEEECEAGDSGVRRASRVVSSGRLVGDDPLPPTAGHSSFPDGRVCRGGLLFPSLFIHADDEEPENLRGCAEKSQRGNGREHAVPERR